MDTSKIWSAEELEQMSPNERQSIVRARLRNGPEQGVAGKLLERTRRKIEAHISANQDAPHPNGDQPPDCSGRPGIPSMTSSASSAVTAARTENRQVPTSSSSTSRRSSMSSRAELRLDPTVTRTVAIIGYWSLVALSSQHRWWSDSSSPTAASCCSASNSISVGPTSNATDERAAGHSPGRLPAQPASGQAGPWFRKSEKS